MGVLGKRKPPWTTEELSRKIAFWHGQRITGPTRTVATDRGYGSFYDAADKYARNHYQEYTAAAEAVLADLKK